MPIEQVLPPPAILWDTILVWPATNRLFNTSTTVDSQVVHAGRGTPVTGGSFSMAIQLGTGGIARPQEHPDLLIPAFELSCGAGPIGTPGEMNAPMPLELAALAASDIAPGVIMPESRRFTWLRHYFDMRAVAPSDEAGLVFGSATQMGSTYWFGSAVAPIFGIIGDGLGGLQWRSQNAAGAIIETVPIPGGLFTPGVINLLEWRVLSAAAGRDASVAVLLNGTLVITRNWTAAPALARPGNGGNSGRWNYHVRNRTPNLQVWTFAMDYRAGAFDHNGVLIPT